MRVGRHFRFGNQSSNFPVACYRILSCGHLLHASIGANRRFCTRTPLRYPLQVSNAMRVRKVQKIPLPAKRTIGITPTVVSISVVISTSIRSCPYPHAVCHNQKYSFHGIPSVSDAFSFIVSLQFALVNISSHDNPPFPEIYRTIFYVAAL